MTKVTVSERIRQLAATGKYEDYLQIESAISSEFTRREYRRHFEGRENREHIDELCRRGRASQQS